LLGAVQISIQLLQELARFKGLHPTDVPDIQTFAPHGLGSIVELAHLISWWSVVEGD